MRVIELPWQADPTCRFSEFVDQPWAILLDSCHDQTGQGRFDIFTADPYATLEYADHRTVLTRRSERRAFRGDPFRLLVDLLGTPARGDDRIPFGGGAIGYLSYEFGRERVGLASRRDSMPEYPELAFGLYDWSVVYDHLEQRCYLATHDRISATRLVWESLHDRLLGESSARERPYRVLAPLHPDITRQEYAKAFRVIQSYIAAGDCYQVNLTQRFSTPSEGRLWTAYQHGRTINPAPFSAYFHHPQVEIASASPERFLKVVDGQVSTRPVKGTARRVIGQERRQRARLRESEKDRAENLMIVDLLRNDLSKNCAPGTVRAPELFKIESFATVHHMVSTVTGTLREGRTTLDLLDGCFPGGSITGAPKRRAMEIIEELEPRPRGAYCGSLVYIGFDGNMDSNIAIRTMAQAAGETSLYAGGGLTHGSEEEAEYQECLDKAAAMRETLERCRS